MCDALKTRRGQLSAKDFLRLTLENRVTRGFGRFGGLGLRFESDRVQESLSRLQQPSARPCGSQETAADWRACPAQCGRRRQPSPVILSCATPVRHSQPNGLRPSDHQQDTRSRLMSYPFQIAFTPSSDGSPGGSVVAEVGLMEFGSREGHS
jgi:hypothetical protein